MPVPVTPTGVGVNARLAAPAIQGLSTSSGPVGTAVIIHGINFGQIQGTSTVTFNGSTATVTVWSVDTLTTTVPGGATTGTVLVTVAGQSGSGSAFTVTPPAPAVVTITSPTSGTTFDAGTSSTLTTLAGTASSAPAAPITAVTWSNNLGGSGTATGTTSWSVASVPLSVGSNVVTVTAANGAPSPGTDVLTVARASAGGTDAIPAIRLPAGGTWNGIVGVIDVDPTTRTKFGATLATTSTVAQINTALTNAGANQYVELAAGTFTLTGDLFLNTDRKTLRGQVNANGTPTTILNFTAATSHVWLSKQTDISDYYEGDSRFAGWSKRVVTAGGATRGATSLTLTVAPDASLQVGGLMFIMAPDSANTGSISTSEFSRFWLEPPPNPGPEFPGYPWIQIVKVTAVAGSVVSFTPAINADYLASLTCKVGWQPKTKQLDYTGMENLDIRCNNRATNFNHRIVDAIATNQCWLHNVVMYGVTATGQPDCHLYVYASFGFELLHCEINHNAETANSGDYGMFVFGCSSMLIANNYFTDVDNICPTLLMGGSVWAYNYGANMRYNNFLSQIVFAHGCQDHYNLFEGNWLPSHYNDGSASGNSTSTQCNLYARNRLTGFDTGKDTNLNAITLLDGNLRATCAGNVMGTTAKQSVYQDTGSGTLGQNEGAIFHVPTTAFATLSRLGNYNYFNAAIPAAEALSGVTVATSYVYTSKPSYFGDRPWPWVDTGNLTQSNTLTNLPAGYRATNGTLPPGATL